MPSPPEPTDAPRLEGPPSEEPAPTFARDDLVRAVEEALSASAHLLTAGEEHVARAFLALPADQGSLYARLTARQGVVFRLDRIAYAEVPDPVAAVRGLVLAGFADHGTARLPTRLLALQLTVPELKAACASLGLPRGGRRAELLQRLQDAGSQAEVRTRVERPLVLLRHPGLFRRLARLFLGRSDGDLSRLVLQRMEVSRWPQYTPTGGGGLFPDRRSMLQWEEGLALEAALWSLEEAERRIALVQRLPADLALVEAAPPAPAWRRRYTGRRFAVRRAEAAAWELERQGRLAEAAEAWSRLLAAGLHRPDLAAQRLALTLERLDQAVEATAACQEWLPRCTPEGALALARTGRRLARKAGRGWAPQPPLASPRERVLGLALASTEGTRPLWHSPAGPRPLEPALVAALAACGRQALHAENGLWTTLFGLLHAELLFAPVPGMLPTPFRSGPLDLGTESFVEQRAAGIAALQERIRGGEAPALLETAWTERHGEAIAGVSWRQVPLDVLQAVARQLGGPALAEVMAVLAQDWGGATRGLPDLVVLEGPEQALPGARPARLPPSLVLAEVKGPHDQLRDAQRLWLHRLAAAGIRVELWHVEARDAGPVLGPGPAPVLAPGADG